MFEWSLNVTQVLHSFKVLMDIVPPCFRLPLSVWERICKMLVFRGTKIEFVYESNRDIRRLRLVCRFFNKIVTESQLIFPLSILHGELDCVDDW